MCLLKGRVKEKNMSERKRESSRKNETPYSRNEVSERA
jgi:hypothetical protein